MPIYILHYVIQYTCTYNSIYLRYNFNINIMSINIHMHIIVSTTCVINPNVHVRTKVTSLFAEYGRNKYYACNDFACNLSVHDRAICN